MQHTCPLGMHPTPHRAFPPSHIVPPPGAGFAQNPSLVHTSPLSQYAPSAQHTLPAGMQNPLQDVLPAAQPAGGPEQVLPSWQQPPGTQCRPASQYPPVPVVQQVPVAGMHFPSQGAWPGGQVFVESEEEDEVTAPMARRAELAPGRSLGEMARAPLRGVWLLFCAAWARGRRRRRRGVERCIVSRGWRAVYRMAV